MDEHSSVSEQVVKMSGYVQRLNALECQIPDELAVDRVLQSLPPSYKGFVLNYNMQGMTKTPSELFAMLKVLRLRSRRSTLYSWSTRPLNSRGQVDGTRERKSAPRRMASQLSFLPRHLSPSPELSASTARVKVTGNATAPST